MKTEGSFRLLWLLVPLILLVQIIAGLSERAQEPDWPHERVPQITPQAPVVEKQTTAVAAGAETKAKAPAQAQQAATPTLDAAQAPDQPPETADVTPEAMVTSGAARIPILVYHHVSDSSPNTRYYTSVSQFEAQMQLLYDQGYTPITLAALMDILEGRVSLPERPIVLTFDDGTADVYQNALPIMQSLGFSGVAFIVVNNLGGQGYLNTDELSELLSEGWEVGSHTMSHADLSKPGVDLGEELNQSLEDLQTELGAPVVSFAYPYAVTGESIFQAVEAAGYIDAVCSGWTNTQHLSSRYCLSRREVMPEMDLKAFQKLIEEP